VTARRKTRKRALDILFEAEQRKVAPLELLANQKADPARPLDPYVEELVEGVIAHAGEIDAVLTANLSDDWTLPRLPAVDRALMRIAIYELRFGAGVPNTVAISEAVALAADLSTDESPRYVNGVLSAIAAMPRPVAAVESLDIR
jgi:N utilization substance protein B